MVNVSGKLELNRLRTLLTAGAVGGLTDDELLERYLTRRDEVAELAFAVLVERHGPMVLRVCRGVLRNAHDAQDAFQAIFLVLARRAGSIRTRSSLGSWLHGAAYRVASASRSAGIRRRRHEARSALGQDSECNLSPTDSDLAPLLHDEINRLPEKFRAPIVLCYLEGLTHEQTAARLHWPVGTVRSRLSRGRDQLRARLTRRGVAPSVALAGMTFAHESSATTVPAPLVSATARAAFELARARSLAAPLVTFLEGVLGMFSTKLKITAVLLFVVAAGVTHATHETTDDATASAPPPRANSKVLPQAEPPVIELRAQLAYDADLTTRLRPKFDGYVTKVNVDIADRVKKGVSLVEVISHDLAGAEREFQMRYLEWQHAKRVLDGREELSKKNAISQQQLVDSRNDEKKFQLDSTLARDRLKAYGATDDQIDRLVVGMDEKHPVQPVKPDETAKLTLTSPINGLVIERTANPGEFVTPNSVMMIVSPTEHLWVWAVVPEEHRSKVRVGQKVDIIIPGRDKPIESKVQLLQGDGSKEPQTVKVRATIPNPKANLFGGMAVRMQIAVP